MNLLRMFTKDLYERNVAAINSYVKFLIDLQLINETLQYK